MTAGASRLALLLAAAYGCGSASPPRPGGRSVAAPTAASSTAQMFDKYCTGCHFDGGQEPNLDAARPVDERTLIVAGLAVAAHRMPPSYVSFGQPDRDAVIGAICRESRLGRSRCLDVLAPSDDTGVAKTAHVFLREVQAADDSKVGPFYTRFLRPATRMLPHDPTLELFRVLLVFERCSVPGADPDCVTTQLNEHTLEREPPRSGGN